MYYFMRLIRLKALIRPYQGSIISLISPYMALFFGAILSNLGNLEPFLNHFGTVFRHLEQFFGHLEDIFEVSVFRGPHGLKNPPKSRRSARFFGYTLLAFFAHFWVHFLANF